MLNLIKNNWKLLAVFVVGFSSGVISNKIIYNKKQFEKKFNNSISNDNDNDIVNLST